MRLIDIPAFLLPLILTTQVLADSPGFPAPKGIPRDLDAILIEPAPSRQTSTILSPSPAPTPFLKHLDLRQVAAAQPAAAPAAAPVVPPAAPAAPVAPVAPAVAPAAAPAPAVGVGGGGAAPPQPVPGAPANPVTTMMVETVVGGVTKQVPKVFTQTFASAESAPPVLSGQIGLGTLTGKVGVVKTQDAKSQAVAVGRDIRWGNVGVVLVAGVAALGGGLLGIARI